MSKARSTRASRRSGVAHEEGADHTKFDLGSIRAQFEVGAEYQVASPIIVRLREDFKSPKVAQLRPGSTVKVLQMGRKSRRARVRNDSFGEGWVSICDPCGRFYIAPNTTNAREAFQSGDCGKGMAACVPHATRDADLLLLQKAVNDCDSQIGRDDWFGTVCTTLGKTTLMSAAAGVYLDFAEFPISKNVSVDVVDEERKTALHHAVCASSERVAPMQALVHASSDFGANGEHVDTHFALAKADGTINAVDDEVVRFLDHGKHSEHDDIARKLKEERAEECPSEADEVSHALEVFDIDHFPGTFGGSLPISVNLNGNPLGSDREPCLNMGSRAAAGKYAGLRNCSAVNSQPLANELVLGGKVRLVGLKNDVGYNGKKGKLARKVRYNGVKTWLVKLENGEQKRVLDENLVAVVPDFADLRSSPASHLPNHAITEQLVVFENETGHDKTGRNR